MMFARRRFTEARCACSALAKRMTSSHAGSEASDRSCPFVMLQFRMPKVIIDYFTSRFGPNYMECPHCHRQTSAHSKNCGSCGAVIPPAQHLLEELGLTEPVSPTTSAPPKQVRREQ